MNRSQRGEPPGEVFSEAPPEPCRLIVDAEPASGAWNMAVDAALLESAVEGGPCTLRWYRWEQATLSLGYFQSPGQALELERFGRLPVVRRLSGGGAIVHHHELTYSCTVPARHALAREARQLYIRVHEGVIDVLSRFGFKAGLRGTAAAGRSHEFLCFSRGDDFDVVMHEHKILGSAQRRRKGAILQHGSLVLRRSEWADRFPGVFDCGGHAADEAELLAALASAVGALFSVRLERSAITANERARAECLIEGLQHQAGFPAPRIQSSGESV